MFNAAGGFGIWADGARICTGGLLAQALHKLAIAIQSGGNFILCLIMHHLDLVAGFFKVRRHGLLLGIGLGDGRLRLVLEAHALVDAIQLRAFVASGVEDQGHGNYNCYFCHAGEGGVED